MSHVVLYAFDSMADWEYAPVVAGLALARRSTRDRSDLERAACERDARDRDVRDVPDLLVASVDGGPVRTLGGLRVSPDTAISTVDPDQVAMLVLPGGDGWSGPDHAAVLALADRLLGSGRAVAGICAATRAMAAAGFLDEVPHTSNSPEFLASGSYHGDSRYIDAPAVGSGDVITASGHAPVAFAREVLRRLGLFDIEAVQQWCAGFEAPIGAA